MQLEIALQPKQKALWGLWDDKFTTRIGFGGARGGAKSGGGRRCMLLRRLRYPRTPGLILRRTYPDLYKSHIVKLFEEYPDLREFWREQSKELKLPNGSRLFFGSAEHAGDLNAFFSSEFADIMPDEAQEWSQGELEQLSGSNRCTSNPDIVPKMVFPFMPGVSETGIPPTGLTYLKRVFVDHDLKEAERHREWKFIQAFSWDNIEWARKELERDGVDEVEFYSWDNETRREYFITRTEYGATLQSLTNKALRDAWLYGKWDVFQGQYFPNFSHEKHVITAAEAKARMKPWHKRWLSGDWGHEHPHCIHWHCEDENGQVITYREQWGREVAEDTLGEIITEMSGKEKLEAFPFSGDAGFQSKRSPRLAPKSIMQMLNDSLGKGIPKAFPVDASAGTRISGARLMSRLLGEVGIDTDGNSTGDGHVYWQISEDCPKLIECIPSLIHDPKNTEDVLKVDYATGVIADDPYDSARYGLQFMLGAAVKPFQVRLQERLATIPMEGTGKFIAHLEMMKKERETGGDVFYIGGGRRRRQ
jgi:phage terminase large subunit